VKYDDETLMAYADGELDAAQRAQIDAAIAQDPALALRVQEHKALRAGPAGRGKVLQFPARTSRAPSPPWRAREWIAMAASLLFGVLLSWRLLVPGNSGLFEAGKGALLARGELARALESQLASQQSGEDRVLIGLTFKTHDGNYCRSFVLPAARTAGLACRVGSEWQIPATESSLVPEGGMQQASAALPPSILRIIEARMEGTALDAEGEENARLDTWNSSP
jgi:hypothetical protein